MDADHGFWGRPEDMNMARYVIIITVVKILAEIIITILEMVVKMSKTLTADYDEQAGTVDRARQPWFRSGQVGFQIKLFRSI